MGLIFFILFAAAEIALVVLTFTKYREKLQWLRNRMIVRGVETLLLLGVVLAPATHLKWRFSIALLILLLRLIIAGVSYFVKHKKAVGKKKKAGTVVGCILSVILIFVSLTPAFLFTNYDGLEPTGEFQVKESNAILVDESRVDTFESDGSCREVPVHFYYPDSEGAFPLVVFSHGAFGYYQSNYSTYTELASHGYVVASLDHPHHAFFTDDTDGNTVIVDETFITDAINITNGAESNEEVFAISREWMELRTDDENFVLDTIVAAQESGKLSDAWHTENEEETLSILSMVDTDKIGLMGHSMGGATAVALGRERSDIDAVIDLDGTMLSEIVAVEDGMYQYNSEPYPTPVLDFGKVSDYNKFEQAKKETGYVYANEYIVGNAIDGRTVLFENAEHMDFTDLPLISPFLASMLGKGTVNSEEFLPMMNGIVLDWFDYYLKSEGTLDIQARY